MMQMNLSTKQTHRHREQTCGCQGGRDGLRVWNQQMQVLHREWINDNVLLYSTEHYIQYSGVMEKNMKKNTYIHLYIYVYVQGFPGGTEVKASACNVGELGSILGSGRSPGEGNGNPLQYSCLENPMDGGAWWATVHGSQRVGHD